MTPVEKQDYEHERLIIDESCKWVHPQDAINATVAWLQCKGAIPESERARLHELTRKITLSDEDLDRMLTTLIEDEPEFGRSELWDPMSALFRDLRDLYEGLGKYAINAPAEVRR